MKKIILVAALAAVFSGCAGMTVQEKVEAYKEARSKVVKTVHVLKCEKDCFKRCDQISNDLDRIDCKATCVDTCHELPSR